MWHQQGQEHGGRDLENGTDWANYEDKRHLEEEAGVFKASPTFQLISRPQVISLTSEPHTPIRCRAGFLAPWAPGPFMAPVIISPSSKELVGYLLLQVWVSEFARMDLPSYNHDYNLSWLLLGRPSLGL